MARQREFDTEAVIQQAMELFWDRGFHGTSIQTLCEETGLKPGSLYAAFGDKRGLFHTALDRYTTEGLAQMATILNQPGSAVAAIRNWLLHWAEQAIGIQGRRGCLVTHSAIELLPHEPEVEARISRLFRRMEDLLAGTIIRAQTLGEVGPDHDEREIARFLLTVMEGMRVLGKVGPDPAAMRALIDTTLRVLER